MQTTTPTNRPAARAMDWSLRHPGVTGLIALILTAVGLWRAAGLRIDPDVLHLLEAAGTVEEKHDGKFTVTLGEETEVFERPHNKDIDTQMVVDLRRMLKNAGFEPRSKGQEV